METTTNTTKFAAERATAANNSIRRNERQRRAAQNILTRIMSDVGPFDSLDAAALRAWRALDGLQRKALTNSYGCTNPSQLRNIIADVCAANRTHTLNNSTMPLGRTI